MDDFVFRTLYLREDIPTEGNCAKDILANASKTDEGYFIAPPGNIPLKKNKLKSESKSASTDLGSDQEKAQEKQKVKDAA